MLAKKLILEAFFSVSNTFILFVMFNLLFVMSLAVFVYCIYNAKFAFSGRYYVGMKLLICSIVFPNVIREQFVFSLGDSKFLFENVWQFRIVRK